MQTGSGGCGRILLASLVGTTIEFYDFYVYATAASLVFGPLFFSSTSSSAQLLASYSSLALAFLARPLGAAVFGHYGDRIGRKSTLVASLLLMGGSTFLIGLLPGYEVVGALAPALLCLMRFGQGLGLGGEWGGAALLAVENAPPGWRARFGMVPQLGAPLGFLLANGLFFILGLALTPAQFVAWGWRLPFFMSAALVIVGLYVRLRLTETPEFVAASASGLPPAVPLRDAFVLHRGDILVGIFAAVTCFALYYVATVFALGYGTMHLHHGRNTMLGLLCAATAFYIVGVLVSGVWSDRASPRQVLVAGCLATMLVAAVLPTALASSSLPPLALFLNLSLFVTGLVYGPLGTWLTSLFPTPIRYTAASLTFSLGGILGGGVTPLIAQQLADRGGLALVGLYLGTIALISFAALMISAKSTTRRLQSTTMAPGAEEPHPKGERLTREATASA